MPANIDDDFINKALTHWKEVTEVTGEFRTAAQDDLEFYSGDQWDWQAREDRVNSGAPARTINRLQSFVHQITNEQKQNRPGIQVDPVGDQADVETAYALTGLIKSIEYTCNGESAYDKAFESAVIIGEGYVRIISEYEQDSFDQQLMIKSIPNTLSVYFDPNSKEIDGSDGNYCFIVDSVSKTDFETMYPESDIIDQALQGGWDNFNDDGWVTSDQIRIAEYYVKDWRHETLYLVNDSQVSNTYVTKIKPKADQTHLVVLKQRDQLCPYIQWYKINGHEILEHTEWPGQWLPVVPIKGEEVWINGERKKWGMIRFLKESQKTYNMMSSMQEELVGLAPKAPFIGVAGFAAGREQQWGNANTTSFGYLEYAPVDIKGQPAPPPQRQSFVSQINDITTTKMQAADDMKSIAGIFDPSLGDQGNEQSGKAILARQQQSSTGNLHYTNNLIQSLKHIGRILVDIIPKYYDTARMIRIVKPNNEQEVIAINQYGSDGKQVNLTTGKYDVRVDTGPSYTTQRQEAIETLTSLASMSPDVMLPMVADLIAGNSDWPESQVMARRLKTLVPPDALKASGDNDDNGAATQAELVQAQTQLKQLGDMHQQVITQLQKTEQELKGTQEENKNLKLKSAIELDKADKDYTIKNKQLVLQEQQTQLQYMVEEQKLDLSREQLQLEKAKLAITGVKAMNDVEDNLFDKTHIHLDKIASLDAPLTPSEPLQSGSEVNKDDM